MGIIPSIDGYVFTNGKELISEADAYEQFRNVKGYEKFKFIDYITEHTNVRQAFEDYCRLQFGESVIIRADDGYECDSLQSLFLFFVQGRFS